MSQPVIAGAGEAVVPSGFQSLLLVASDPIHRLSQMLSDMEFVEDDLPIRSRHVLPNRGDVGSHMSMATASMLCFCSSVRASQKPSRLLCCRPSATYITRPRTRSFTSVK